MNNSLSDNAPRTLYMGEQMLFNPMALATGENRTRKLGTISSGAGTYSDLTTDLIITINCNQMGRLGNFENAYLVADINNTNAASVFLPGRGGTHMIIYSMTIAPATGSKFSDVQNYNVLMGIELAKHVDTQYLNSWGAGMFGMAEDDIGGAEILPGGSKTLVIPFHLSSALKLLPMWGQESIEIRLKIADPRTVYIGNANLAQGEITYSNVKFIYETVDIPPDIFKSFVAHKKDTYVISGKDWYSMTATIPANNTDIEIQIPINKASVSKVILALRTTANIIAPAKNSLCSRNRGFYTESYLKYNGVAYPLTTVTSKATSVAEMLAELAINNGNHLLNISSSFVNEDGKFLTANGEADDAATSTYGFYEFYLGNSLENDDSTYSGLRVDNSTLTVVLGKGVYGEEDEMAQQTCNIFVEYQSRYTLQNGFWKIEF